MAKRNFISKEEARSALRGGAGLRIYSAAKGVKAHARIGFGVVRMDVALSLRKELRLTLVERNCSSARWLLC